MAGFLISVAISLVISVVLTVAKMLLFPQQKPQQRQNSAAKPSDGKYNFKQNVPSLTRVYGRVKKAGDQFFLEERGGGLLSGTVLACHKIEGYVAHYLHDEVITLSGGETGNVIAPLHFYTYYDGGLFVYVTMDRRLGESLETAYPALTTVFSDIWTADHRGDALATVLFGFSSPPARHYSNIFPQGVPSHSAVLDGALVYDPRTNQDPDDPETWSFSSNLALIRLDHITHVSGLKLSKDDLYLPEWESAADISDQVVLNRLDEEEPRYHGGLWYRYEDDQVEIGKLIDEAAEMVIYERNDGKIGVHPGVLVNPDITITENDMFSFHYDVNKRLATNVLAVRGRYTDPDATYNTVDAAIYGDPYIGEGTQRTRTIDNQAVQYHNHMQRLQKLAMIRANAARVSISVFYDVFGPIRNIRERRFVYVTYAPRDLDNAIVEIIGRPKLDLSSMTYSFDGIIVPSSLYSFDAATEEGVKSTLGEEIVATGVPVPENFAIGIGVETVAAGTQQAYGIASWDFVSNALTYELEWQIEDESEVAQSVISRSGDTEVRTPGLKDGTEYRFRLRTLSNEKTSEWTDYETEVATADNVPPDDPSNFDSVVLGADVELSWDNPNSWNLYATKVYRGTTPTFGSAINIHTYYGGVGEPRVYRDYSLPTGNTYYWWIRSFNASGAPSNVVGPESQTM